MKIGEILSRATNTLFSKLGKSILAVLAYLLISFLIGLLNILPVIGGIAMYVLLIPIAFGFIKQFIKLYNGEEVNAFDFLNLGFEKFGMSWRVTGRLILKYIIPIIIMIISSVFLVIGATTGILGSLGAEINAEVLNFTLIIAIIGFIIATFISIVLSLKYMFAYNELAYNDNATTGKEIVENAAKNMKGNKGKLVGLYLVVILIVIGISLLLIVPVLGLIVFVAILLLVVPFIQFVMVAFYDSARKEKMQNTGINIVLNEEVIFEQNNEPQDPIQNI